MDSCTDIWNLLHDGSIVQISGNIPGTLTLAIDIEYLRERFSDPGDKIILTLLDCSQFIYKPWSSTDEELSSFQQIAERDLEILSADREGGCCIVTCSEGFGKGGTLEIVSAGAAFALDSGREITVDDLGKVGNAYWTEWGAEAQRNRQH